jgi:three-Cys-motif partner protein
MLSSYGPSLCVVPERTGDGAEVKQFFDESTEQSRAKASIVAKYFDAWAKVITRSPNVDRVAYLDLFAGPGRYKDGTVSTPLLVLEKAIADPKLCRKLVCLFNDVNGENTSDLQRAIDALPGIEKLKHKPVVWNEEVGTEMVKQFKENSLVPTLFFVDPWGYKGLSLELVNSVVKDWACECVFFFNYNRINMGLSNPRVVAHMNALFGQAVADDLRRRFAHYLDPSDRELAILESICLALNPDGARFVLPFTFKNEAGTRTRHHLIFVSKHPLGYSIMKQIMAGESTSAEQGVASFMYSPADKNFPILFEYGRPLDDLEGLLLARFAGRALTVQAIYDAHNVGTPYILKNYKDAVKSMDEKGSVDTTRTESHRKRGQCPDDVEVTFPGGPHG